MDEQEKYAILKAQGDRYAKTGDVSAFRSSPFDELDRLRGVAPKTPLKHYVVIWERIANSGYAFIEADNPVDAVRKMGYSPKFCKMTAVEIVNQSEVYTEGVAN